MVGGWEELEQKVLQLVKKNADLRVTHEKLNFEYELLKEKVEHLEMLLLKDSEVKMMLEEEKKAMKNSIDLMLTSINSIESV